MNFEKNFSNITFYISAFLLPIILAALALSTVGVPFGGHSITGSDLGSQFLPIAVFKMRMLKSKEISLFHCKQKYFRYTYRSYALS